MSAPDLCTECGRPLEDEDEVQRSIDGSGAHHLCVQEFMERLDALTEGEDDR